MKKLLVALAVGVAVFAAAYASAATLNGLGSDDLGSDDSLVASCDTDGVVTSYQTSYDATQATYVVDTVTVGNINTACNTQTIKVTLTGAANVALGDGTLTVSGTSAVVTIAGVGANPPKVHAEDVVGLHVVITG
ncbi:MAG: hypothetical protein U0446_07120 [Dehalococcoidia bacterium]